MSNESEKPFGELGERLRSLREHIRESLEDASGAAEIDAPTLQSFEEGRERPDEDILHVLLHHFDASDDVAEELWGLAGYQVPKHHGKPSSDDEDMFQSTPAMLILPIDGRILYTDSVQVGVNKQGVVLNFMQNVHGGKTVPVSRVGMSKSHAQSLIKLLQDCLDNVDPKQLSDKNNSDKQG